MRKKTARPPGFSRGTKGRRFLPIFFFILSLAGTCVFLYVFAILPRQTDASIADAQEGAPEETTAWQILTRDSTKVYMTENRVSTSGVGRILEDTAQGKLLARRAALVDARRNLLELRQKLLGEPILKFGSRSVSGHIVAPNIRSERTKGDLYFIELDVQLEELLKTDLDEEVFILP
ncbi:MAG: hypothetical protein LBQ42_00485 [Synergistaceae bacterium]|jgi:hypothetical protein|nr:hypothetical protein [Synergistaceae bacterium]